MKVHESNLNEIVIVSSPFSYLLRGRHGVWLDVLHVNHSRALSFLVGKHKAKFQINLFNIYSLFSCSSFSFHFISFYSALADYDHNWYRLNFRLHSECFLFVWLCFLCEISKNSLSIFWNIFYILTNVVCVSSNTHNTRTHTHTTPTFLSTIHENFSKNSDSLTTSHSSTLTPMHLRKAKLMFFWVRYPSSSVLKMYFPDIKFNKNNTAQLVKWFSNFR